MGKAVRILKHFETPKKAGTHYRLVCLTGKNKGMAYFLEGDRAVLGRSEKVDIRVLDIKSSREHAEIVKVNQSYIITDLGSQNGIIVNDLKVKQHTFKEGDKLIIGQTAYKFNQILVKEEANKVAASEFKEESFEEDDKTQNKKTTYMLGLVAILALVILFSGEDVDPNKGRNRKQNYKLNEVSDPFIASLKTNKKENKKNKEKLNIYFSKGLREYREGNFFRAINEFEHALSWSPGDPLADFYLRKTRDALDNLIQDLFIKAKRDEDSLKYKRAVVSYCAIIRLLFSYKEDERYKSALENVTKVEEVLGMEPGEIKCIEEIE